VAEVVKKIMARDLNMGIPTYQASTMENRMNELEEEEKKNWILHSSITYESIFYKNKIL
jgi:hypothetical protein